MSEPVATESPSASDLQASNAPLRILVVRPDRLGDVLLSTPVFEVIKRHYPKSRLSVMVQAPAAPVIRGLRSVDEVLIYEPAGRHSGLKGFFRLLADIRKGDFRIAVVLHSPWRVGVAVFWARIRYRLGPFSKLHSFLTYNRGLRQRRSHVEMHESDYNLQLLRKLGIRVGTRDIRTSAAVSPAARAWGREWLEAKGWKAGETLVVVHPGMGGSALNWPENHYVELIRALLKEGRKVLVTGGPDEGALLQRIRDGIGTSAAQAFFYGGPDARTVENLGGLFAFANVVVAPSTGPLHLAVALEIPVVTFFPPIRVQSALRWGPYLTDESRASILVPEVYCGEDFKCRGNLCNFFPCMRSLTVGQALEEANRQLARPAPPVPGVEADPASQSNDGHDRPPDRRRPREGS